MKPIEPAEVSMTPFEILDELIFGVVLGLHSLPRMKKIPGESINRLPQKLRDVLVNLKSDDIAPGKIRKDFLFNNIETVAYGKQNIKLLTNFDKKMKI